MINHTSSDLLVLELIDRIVVRDVHAVIFRKKYGGRLDKLLPPVMIGCQSGFLKGIGETIHNLEGQTFHPLLQEKLETLGTIGKPSPICKNIVGKCAEDDAANKVLMSDSESSIKSLQQLWFTDSLRPRTFQSIPACKNCEFVFGKDE